MLLKSLDVIIERAGTNRIETYKSEGLTALLLEKVHGGAPGDPPYQLVGLHPPNRGSPRQRKPARL